MRWHREQVWRIKEFRKAKDNLLLVSLERQRPWQQYRLGAGNCGAALEGTLEDSNQSISRQCALAAKRAKSTNKEGFMSSSAASRLRKMTVAFCSVLC